MKICRFQHASHVGYGLMEDSAGSSTITRMLDRLPAGLSDFDSAPATRISVGEVRLLSPTQPSKIVCVGRNYREHAKELNHEIPTSPLIFLKPPSAVIAHGDEIRRPHKLSQRVDHEGELGVVIGKRCHDLRDDEDVRPYILGYTCVNDVTARDLQNLDGQWTRAKGFDTFCPIGPVIADGLDPVEGCARRNPAQRRNTAVGHHVRFHLSSGRYRALYHLDHDAVAGRRNRHGYPSGSRSHATGRRGRDYRRRRG